jgi:hypothetical protein
MKKTVRLLLILLALLVAISAWHTWHTPVISFLRPNYPLPLEVVVGIGLFQYVVVRQTADLAIASLPADEKIRNAFKHRWTSIFCASCLFTLTCIVGYINDASQFATHQASLSLKGESDDLKKMLVEAMPYIKDRKVQERVFRTIIKYPPAPGMQSFSDKPPSSPDTQSSPTKSVYPPTPPLAHQPDTKLQLHNRIQGLLSQLKNADKRNDFKVSELLHAPRTGFIGETDSSQSVNKSLQERQGEYAAMQSEMKSLRADVQLALSMTPQQIADDDATFDRLNTAASTLPVFSKNNWMSALTWKFVDVKAYFQQLDKKLGFDNPENRF